MQLALRLSKFNDLDLYAYFARISYGRSTLVKSVLRDYIQRTHITSFEHITDTASTYVGAEYPKILLIPIHVGRKDTDIATFLSDCPSHMKIKCVKSILRMMIAPYTQSIYHVEPQPLYLPNHETIKPASGQDEQEFWKELVTTLIKQQSVPSSPPQASPYFPSMNETTESHSPAMAQTVVQKEERISTITRQEVMDGSNPKHSEEDDLLLSLFGVDYD